jgi:hypothetical protein
MNKVRLSAGALSALMAVSISGCGGGTVNAGSGPYDRPEPIRRRVDDNPGMTGKQKMLLVAGAAAMYYLYNKHKDKQGHGAEGQYYRSKNGRIYYRDENGKAVWVTPPTQPIQVPADEYARYTGQSVDRYGNGQVLREAPAGW